MNKQNVIDQIANESGQTKKAVSDTLEGFMKTIMEALSKGDSVTFTGFGTFKVAHRKERTGRNPQTGEEIKIPARNVPTFKPGKVLKETVR